MTQGSITAPHQGRNAAHGWRRRPRSWGQSGGCRYPDCALTGTARPAALCRV